MPKFLHCSIDVWRDDCIHAGSEIDYPNVMVEYEKQGHEWATRWTASYGAEDWKDLLARAYSNFTADDEAKFVRWLHQEK